MADFETEEQQVEALKAWVAQNYKAILLGVGIGLGGIFGWRYYEAHQVDQAQAAAALVHQMQQLSAEQTEALIELNQALRDDYSGTAYATFGALLVAKHYAQNADLSAAAEQLNWVLDNNDEPETQALTRLRLGRVQLASGELDAVESLLDEDFPGAFAGMENELRGDLALARGDQQAAYEAYQQAQNVQLPVLSSSEVLSMKLNDLTPAKSSSASESSDADS